MNARGGRDVRAYNAWTLSHIPRILVALCMVIAIAVCQQIVALHDLAHAAGHKQESTPGKTVCDKCFACAELSAAVGLAIPSVSLNDVDAPVVQVKSGPATSRAAHPAFRARAPPMLL
jgi:hypothetical protein